MTNKQVKLIVMGVAGSGKTTFGLALAKKIQALYLEGDKFHSEKSIDKMSSGIPLDDQDRFPWLRTIAKEVDGSTSSVVASCSALRQAYRDELSAYCPKLKYIYLQIKIDEAKERVKFRQGHFMPSHLVDSQFKTLEPPKESESVLKIDACSIHQSQIELALKWLEFLDFNPSLKIQK